MKFAIYARVSPRGSSYEIETTIKMQIKYCKDFIEAQRGEVVEIQSDEFYSGKDMNRPGFRKLMADMRSGKAEWDCLCVYKLSRMSRSIKDGSLIFEEMKQYNKGFVSATEPAFDFSTPMGRAMLGIFQVFNQFEREQTSENTRNKMLSIAEAGEWPVGGAPFGYKRIAKHNNVLVPDPRKAEQVRMIFEAYLSATPLSRIAKRFNRCPQSILYILRNRTYLGEICYAGNIYPGKHEPIITKELFDAVQKTLPEIKQKGTEREYSVRQKKHSRVYALAGLLRCGECGAYLTPASAKSGQYFYYRCTDNVNCKNKVSAPKIEEAVIEILKKQKLDPEFIRGFRDAIAKIRKDRAGKFKKEMTQIGKALAEAREERDKVVDLMLNEHLLTKSNIKLFNTKLDRLNLEVADLEAKEEYYKAEIQRTDDNIPSCLERLADEMLTLSDLAAAAELGSEEWRKICCSYIKKATLAKNGSVAIELQTLASSPKYENGNLIKIRT